MKFLQIHTSILFVLLLLSCKENNTGNTANAKIPELINRPQLIGPEEEMGYTLDTYNSLVSKIKANPADLESRLTLAELFMQEARISGEHGYYYPNALQLIEGVLTSKPEPPIRYRALLDKGSVQLSLHQFQQAKMTAEEALALNAHSADVYGILADAHVELGIYDKAIEYADKMVSIRPDLRSYSRISYLREIHGQVDGAIEAMKLAVAAGYPGTEQTEWARLTLGDMYERYGKADSAMQQYQLALSFRPNYPFAIGAMASAYASKGDFSKADSLNQVAMNLIPEVSFYVQQAEWDKERGYAEKSKKLTAEILDMLADDTEAGHKMGMELSHVYFDLAENTEKALASLMEEYDARPDNIDVNKHLAELYLYTGETGKAQEHLAKAKRTGSQDPELKCLDGMVMVKTDRVAEATQILRSVFVENPNLDCRFCKEAKAIIL